MFHEVHAIWISLISAAVQPRFYMLRLFHLAPRGRGVEVEGGGERPDIHATASLARPRLPPPSLTPASPLFVFCGLPYFLPAGSLAVPDCTEIKIPRHPANCTFI